MVFASCLWSYPLTRLLAKAAWSADTLAGGEGRLLRIVDEPTSSAPAFARVLRGNAISVTPDAQKGG